MEIQKLSVKACMLAGGILWGGALLFVGLVNEAFPSYGRMFLDAMGSVYIWHPEVVSTGSAFALGGLGFIDGATGGLLFSVLYNLCSGCCKKKIE